jgi:hypothetical protein
MRKSTPRAIDAVIDAGVTSGATAMGSAYAKMQFERRNKTLKIRDREV